MGFLLSSFACVALLSACGGPSLTPEQKATRKANIARTEEALKSAKKWL